MESSSRPARAPTEAGEAVTTTRVKRDRTPMDPEDMDSPIRSVLGGALPLSRAQVKVWELVRAGHAVPNCLIGLELHGVLHRGSLTKALERLIERHEMLRVTVHDVRGEPVQIIGTADQLFALTEQQLHVRDTLDVVSREERDGPFDLTVGPLVRGRLVKISEDEHVLFIVQHPIIADDYSNEVFMAELLTLYGALVAGQSGAPALPPPKYVDFLDWEWRQHHAVRSGGRGEPKPQNLSGKGTAAALPTDRPRGKSKLHEIRQIDVVVPPRIAYALRTAASDRGTSLSSLLLSGWMMVLYRWSGQNELIIGVRRTNRERSEVSSLIGRLEVTGVLRICVDEKSTVEEMSKLVSDVESEALTPQGSHFRERLALLEGDIASPPNTTVVSFEGPVPRRATHEEIRIPDLTVRRITGADGATPPELELVVADAGEELAATLKYPGELWEPATASRVIESWVTLLEGIAVYPRRALWQLPILTPGSRDETLRQVDVAGTAVCDCRPVHSLFEEQVKRTADAVAVIYGAETVTFRELNERANRLARYLRMRGIGPGDFVGLCVERSVDMVVGFLGTLKAGAAYVPLDPSWPTERLAYMLADVAPRMLLVQEYFRAKLPAEQAEVFALDADWHQLNGMDTGDMPWTELGLRAEHLAYVIYTSGSTGKPKGVMVEHGGLSNYVQWALHAYLSGTVGAVIVSSPVTFDATVTSLYLPLLSGRPMVLVPTGHELEGLEQLLLQPTQWALIKISPAHLQVLGQRLNRIRTACTVGTFVIGGEALLSSTVALWRSIWPQVRLVNEYGPTETVVGCSIYDVPPGWHSEGSVPIGHPIPNTRMYILDAHRQLLPIGAVGEIYIGGAGVSRGYLNRPELTAERFVADPFQDGSSTRLYRSGDLGRWRIDGTLEYLGRNDEQVKIRGFRIELGEIESQLLRHPIVHEAVVLAREDTPGDKRLVAYVTTRDGSALSVDDLRAHLGTVMPDYMVPGAFVSLKSLPLTGNGKVNRRALPAPDLNAYVSQEYAKPEGPVEQLLAALWQQLLHLERVGRRDNFFQLGGHSLMIARMLERLRDCGISAHVRTVYDHPVLADLARELIRAPSAEIEVPPCLIPTGCQAITPQMLTLVELEADQIDSIVQVIPGGAGNIQDIYPLLPLQEGMLFHGLLGEGGGDLYILPTLLAVSSRALLDHLIEALQSVIDRHDALRTAVLWEDLPHPVQVVCRRVALPIEQVIFDSDRSLSDQLDEWLDPRRQRLNLQLAPPLRLKIAPDSSGTGWYALLQVHHLECDHESYEALLSEVAAYVEGRAHELPKPLAYRTHVARVLAIRKQQDSKAFFRSKLQAIDEPTAPFGLLDVHGDGIRISEVRQALEPALGSSVRAAARRLGTSPATVFHAAWALVLAHTSGRSDVVFGTVLMGRLEGNASSERTLGMFLNTLPLCLRVGSMTAGELLGQTQRELLELLTYEQTPLTLAQSCSGIESSAPLFTSLFNYLHGTSSRAPERAQMTPGVRILSTPEWTNYPIALSVEDQDDRFVWVLATDRRIDPHRLLAYASTALQSLVDALEGARETPALELRVLPEPERNRVVELFNATSKPYPHAQLIHELFEKQTQRTPDAIAVVSDGRILTYEELNRRANQVAHHLTRCGAQVGEYIPILMSRCLEMLIAQLAVLKVGAAYVPVDPTLPPDRLTFIVRDCHARRVLSDRGRPATLGWDGVELIDVDACEDLDAGNPKLQGVRPAAAYVMYTSGSTGAPKGVVVPHHAVNRLVINNGYADIGPTDRIAHCSNPAFDASTFEIWAALLNGASVLIVPQSTVLDAELLVQALAEQHVTVFWMTVSLFAQYVDVLRPVFPQLRYLIIGGDVVEPRTVNKVLRINPPRHLLNAYGPTECTTFSTTCLIETVDETVKTIPIGCPIANARIYILDAGCQPVPIDAVGELYIGGAGVAMGYLNRPELTAERFGPDIFSSDPGARLYRTGDLGRWRADGKIEFLGRHDHQVKIRGFRIELGEIEARLLTHPQLKDTVVVALESDSGEKRLVAYAVPKDFSNVETVPSPESLRAHLTPLLPEYMVPSAFVVLPKLPLTVNGKLDRKALPPPERDAYTSRSEEMPQGHVEKALASIWQRLLGIERVGRNDHFFRLGGHSLLALKVLLEINRHFHSGLRVTDLYQSPILRELAARVTGKTAAEELVNLSEEATLTGNVVAQQGAPRVPSANVLLTGATGFVGRFLLARLLQETDATLYCLVRSESPQQGKTRVGTTLSKWELWREEYGSRVVVVSGDLAAPDLGLQADVYRALSVDVDSIYHCATSMNHLESYQMAKAANVEGSKELIKLAATGSPKLINYISTLDVFGARTGDQEQVVDERTPIDLERHLTSQGYCASKWVGEKIFMIAGERGIPVNIFRVGLVWADTCRGRYDELQREYRILKSSLLSGFGIQDYQFELPPTPVDYVTRAVVSLASSYSRGQGVFHISSPSPMSEGLFERLNRIGVTSLELLPFHDWIREIYRLHIGGWSLPAVPLLEFAFEMDQNTFYEKQRSIQSCRPRIDCGLTHRELEKAGIMTPDLNDDLFRLAVEYILSRDMDVAPPPGKRRTSESGATK